MTRGRISYRRFRARDWPRVRQYLRAEGEVPDRRLQTVATERIAAWLALDGRELVGWILTYPLVSEDGLRRGGVENIVVARSHRRRGIGRRLLELAEAHYGGKGLPGMQLTVRADNEPARRLYESMGYSVVQHRLRMWKEFR